MPVKIADAPESFKCDMWNHFAFLVPRNEKREKGDRQSKTMCTDGLELILWNFLRTL